MATIDLGKIKLTWKGTYNPATAYVADDVVAYTDTGVISTYICTAPSTGNAPSTSGVAHASWAYMSKGVALSGSAQGDIPYFDGSTYQPLAAGTAGYFLKTQGAGANPVWAALNEYNDAQLQNNIALLGWKIATLNSLSKYNLDDQIIDDFKDSTGIDLAGSTAEKKISGGFQGLSGVLNYWGDGSDGIVTITTLTELTVENKVGDYDGDMVIKNYSGLTIDNGVTLTTDAPCRGLLIFVDGDCTINGTISMRGKGAFADPTTAGGSDGGVVDGSGLQFPYLHSASSETLASVDLAGCGSGAVSIEGNFPALSSNGKVFTVARQGANGGGSVSGSATGNQGSSGTNQTGGGGSGGVHDSGNSGAGSFGSCFAGGSGGGGSRTGSASAATAWAGQGGNAGSGTNCAGGAGNPNGTDIASSPGPVAGEPEGTGGLIGLFVSGNLTVSGTGSIDARGSFGNTAGEGGGGNSGSGAILIGYAGTYTNSGSVTVASRGVNTNTNNGKGGDGGAGTSTIAQVDLFPGTADNMTLISNATTANASPNYGDLIIEYEDKTGTATLNTDLKGYISRDNGSTWTEGTLVAEGSPTSPKKLCSFHNLTLTGSAGTSMKYKIETLNQSTGVKSTKITASALGWN